jgi:hypothetical protein
VKNARLLFGGASGASFVKISATSSAKARYENQKSDPPAGGRNQKYHYCALCIVHCAFFAGGKVMARIAGINLPLEKRIEVALPLVSSIVTQTALTCAPPCSGNSCASGS